MLDITYADLETTAGVLDAGREEMTATLTALQNRITDLTSQGFTTDAASGAFSQSYAELNRGIIQAVEALEGMAEFLRATAATYQQVDADLAAGIAG